MEDGESSSSGSSSGSSGNRGGNMQMYRDRLGRQRPLSRLGYPLRYKDPCKHRPQSGQCPECREHLRCPHGRMKNGMWRHRKGCTKCCAGTKSLCECGSGKWKGQCGDCGRLVPCKHSGKHKKLRKENCKKCSPKKVCNKHGLWKHSCVSCTPAIQCPHSKSVKSGRKRCPECTAQDKATCRHSTRKKGDCVKCSPHLECHREGCKEKVTKHVRANCPVVQRARYHKRKAAKAAASSSDDE